MRKDPLPSTTTRRWIVAAALAGVAGAAAATVVGAWGGSVRSTLTSTAGTLALRALRYGGPARFLLRSDRYLHALVRAWGNVDWSADVRYLREIVTRSRNARVVVESGSGISTLVAAAAVGRGSRVVAFEHLDEWADRVEAHRPRAVILRRPLLDCGEYDWYDVRTGDLPSDIDLVICDGPPGTTRGGRYGLLPETRDRLAPGARILLDDAARESEAAVIARWQEEGVSVESFDGDTAVLRVGSDV